MCVIDILHNYLFDNFDSNSIKLASKLIVIKQIKTIKVYFVFYTNCKFNWFPLNYKIIGNYYFSEI